MDPSGIVVQLSLYGKISCTAKKSIAAAEPGAAGFAGFTLVRPPDAIQTSVSVRRVAMSMPMMAAESSTIVSTPPGTVGVRDAVDRYTSPNFGVTAANPAPLPGLVRLLMPWLVVPGGSAITRLIVPAGSM